MVEIDDLLPIMSIDGKMSAKMNIESSYPFGMMMTDRQWTQYVGDRYRFGFNGMEKDDEMKGQGNSYTTEFRMYDSRLGKWLSLDPLMSSFPHVSPYAAYDNNPIYFTDPSGLAPSPEKQAKKKQKELKKEGIEAELTTWENSDGERMASLEWAKGDPGTEGGVLHRVQIFKEDKWDSYYRNRRNTAWKEGAILKSIEYQLKYAIFNGPGKERELEDKLKTIVEPLGQEMANMHPALASYNLYQGTVGDGIDAWGNEMDAADASFAALDLAGLGIIGDAAKAARLAQRLHHIFGKSEHALEGLVKLYGSQEKAFQAVQEAANLALKNGELLPNPHGILPTGDAGHIIKVGDISVRLIGGLVKDGKVILSSFSRKGL